MSVHPSVRLSIRQSVRTSLGAIQPGLRPSQPGLRPSQPGLGGRGTDRLTDGRTNGRTNVWTENLPILQESPPIWAAALPPPMKTKEKVEQGKGTADYLMPLGYLLQHDLLV